ncbi:tail fiber protein [Pseudomonas sp. MF6772]|jgi:microcystin-dependent protein|uniref:phage tail protein n=1 Tax=Pseudomonas TaxID=286 RepID=UPI001474A140|nr:MULTISPECIES: tail fiber protein [Pseudomonas]MBJ2270955.1 tail fiber protein [Pseudomonas sp. MF6772]MBL7231006.1 tail fiber protein [Pseudomonas sp.]MCU0209414.1 tail fiber protein [Pseudomonas shahriarae]MDD1130701.1 tail fiber protein [Pseudomonas shahriarae]NMY19272.1 phage tail protein [Pseudomonas sp. WS 5410]
MDAFTGEIRLLPFNFAPQDWAYCDGSVLTIQQYPALFSVIGYAYGGSVGQNFKLPNLNGRAAMGAGNGTGLLPRPIGTAVGADQVMLLPANIPSHTHAVNAKSGTDSAAAVDTPDGSAYLSQPRNVRVYNNVAPASGDPTLAAGTIGSAGQMTPGSSTTRSTLQPFLTLAYCICLNGEYPVRP